MAVLITLGFFQYLLFCTVFFGRSHYVRGQVPVLQELPSNSCIFLNRARRTRNNRVIGHAGKNAYREIFVHLTEKSTAFRLSLEPAISTVITLKMN